MLCEAPTRSLICGARSCIPVAERSPDATGERFVEADDFIRFSDIAAISSGPLLSLVDLEKLQLGLMAEASIPTLLLCSI
jgi:hypothetical protein